VALAAGLAAAPALGQGAPCDRTDLQSMVDGYISAQTTGDIAKLPLADWTQYYEQYDMASMFGGVLSIIAAANAYLNYFDNKKVVVPWGAPRARLEGGLYSGKGAVGQATPEDTCNVGVPNGVKLIERVYMVDPASAPRRSISIRIYLAGPAWLSGGLHSLWSDRTANLPQE
jgi:hypothetical protein